MGSVQIDDEHYTLQGEAQRLFEGIVNDKRLHVPEEAKKLASSVKFVGDETQPFYPVPYKCAESQGALLGYVGLLANTISNIRYGIEQDVQIDVGQALMNGLAALFVRAEGEWLSGNKQMIHAVQRWDHGQTRELYRQLATNIYKTKDNRWYSLHGSMNPTPLLTMLGVPQQNDTHMTWPEILEFYSKLVAELDSETIDNWSNNVYRVPGTICYEAEEFAATAHGQAIKDEPYYNLLKDPYYTQPPVAWGPTPSDDKRPLAGIKILDLARAIAAPTVGRVCAALGATVIRVSSATNTELPITLVDGCIGKISVDINLKTFEGRKKLMELIEDADVFVDGYRPSVLEHLGFGRDAVFGLVEKRNKGIIYCQENCYGWKGPWVTRPGWAQIADTLTGIGLGIGRFNGFDEAHIFPGPNADYLTGHAGVAGVLHAILLRSQHGGSYTVQCSLTTSNLQMLSYGTYTEPQLAALKNRNPDLVGHMRHYDEIVSHGVNRHCVRGYIADRGFERAIKSEYYQEVDGAPWGWGKIQIANLAIKFGSMRTDWVVGPAPPGWHLPKWTVERNDSFEMLPVYVREQKQEEEPGK